MTRAYLFCPICKARLSRVKPPSNPQEEYNETHICKVCKSKWLIVYEGDA